MLTVKWVANNGDQITHLAHQIRAVPMKPAARPAGVELLKEEGVKATLSPAFPAKVEYEREDGTMCSIDTGTVYVMNEMGKTIDTYYLSHAPQNAE